ncbi:MAG: cytochrome c peroxidase [Campylobacterota bacterium]|nr:cytochrome c peroxidase [Campylobacterota bacterium]
MQKSLLLVSLLFMYTHAAELIKDTAEWIRPSVIPAPKDNPITKEKIALGKKLFYDPILSRANNISCMSCHDPVKGWSDSDKVATGDKGRKGSRNSPTILNSAYQYIYFWDGRAKSLEEQSLGPIESHVEMNLSPEEAVKRLQRNAVYVKMFKEVFPEELISTDTLAKALATFERSIVSGESRFDKWIAGDATQVTDAEAKGFHTFLTRANCNVCHSTFRFSDQSFNNIGIDNNDTGRAKIKNRTLWKGAFKTPTLRNIENSAPYFHDGSVATLKEAVEICAKGGRDKNASIANILIDKKLSDAEVESIVTFLETLSEPVPDL